MEEYTPIAEGAELTVGASGPMPPDAQPHLTSLVNNAAKRKPKPTRSRPARRRPKLKLLRAEDVDQIADVVVASGMAAAEEDIDALDAEYARREAAIQAAPPTPDAEKANRLAALAARIREVVDDARADGVRFSVPVPVEKPVG